MVFLFRISPSSEAVGVTASIGRVACLRFGADMLVPLPTAAVRVARALCQHVGAAAGCRCSVEAAA